MPAEYLTVPLRKLAKLPGYWQLAQQGWNLVDIYGPTGTAYAIFRRDEPPTP